MIAPMRFAAFFLLLLGAILHAAPPVHAAERGFSLTGFDTIRVEGPYQVDLRTGVGSSGRAVGAREAIERVVMTVTGTTLVIRADRTNWKGSGDADAGPVLIRLTTGDLRRITLIGSGALKIDRLRGPRADIALQGSGRIAVDAVAVDRVDLVVAGSGGVALGGAVKAMNARAQGAARIDAPGLVVNDLVLSAQGDGDVAIGAKGTAKVTSTGAGTVAILGKPACTVNALGAGTVRCGG